MYSSKKSLYANLLVSFAFVFALAWLTMPSVDATTIPDFLVLIPDSEEVDTGKAQLPYPIKDKKPYQLYAPKHPLDLNDPANIQQKFELDPDKMDYIV